MVNKPVKYKSLLHILLADLFLFDQRIFKTSQYSALNSHFEKHRNQYILAAIIKIYPLLPKAYHHEGLRSYLCH